MSDAENKLVFKTATEIARLIREREISAVEVLSAFLAQIETHNPKINAFATLDAENAMNSAKEADESVKTGENLGALHGVPVTVKDTWETANLRTMCGFNSLKNHIPKQDAPVVAKLKAAGAIILGKSNIPVLSFDIQTNNPLAGRTNNPHDVEKTCGGSTGGGAAAIAAGFSALELGGDFGGSIRIPAHFCGVFGFKPSESRVSNERHILPLPNRSGQVPKFLSAGPIARSVADLRLCLSLIEKENTAQTLIEQNITDFRLAWTNDFVGIPVQTEIAEAIKKLAMDLETANCQIEQTAPNFDLASAWQTWGEIALADMCSSLPFVLKNILRFGLWRNRHQSALNRAMSNGVSLSKKDYAAAETRRTELTADLDKFFETYDAWILPVAATVAFSHQKPGAKILINGQEVAYSMSATAFTCPFSATGNPALVMPLAKTKDGLPIGLQIIGRHGEDYKLLAIAEKLSEIIQPLGRPTGF